MSKVTLSVSMADTGQVSVAGPLHDKLLCYGLLEQAKDAVRMFKEPLVQPASNGDVLALSGPRLER